MPNPIQPIPSVSPDQEAEHPAGVGAKKAKKALDLSPEDFMKLFLEQLKHQNPSSPMDTSTMLQQMANIGQINASGDMQLAMRNLQSDIKQTLGTSQVLGASQLVGKNVQCWADKIPLVAKEGLSGSVGLPKAASAITVTIKDSAGKEVKTLDLGGTGSAGLVDFKWDGKVTDAAGIEHEVAPGVYEISATAMIDGKKTPPLKTTGTFKVNSVALDKKVGVIVNINELGGKYMKDIVKIM